MATEGSGARLVRNTLANGLGTFAGVLIALILTPFMIRDVGVEAYGVWVLALSLGFLGGYASLTDLGIEGATARYVAEARSEGDAQALNRTASTTMASFGVLALVTAPLLAALSIPLVDLFGVDADMRSEARACFALVAAQLLFELPARTYFAVIEGAQRFTVYQGIELTRALCQAALFAVALIADLGIVAFGAAMPISSVLVLAVAWVAAHRAVPELDISTRHMSRTELRHLFTFGTGLFAIRLTGTIYRQMDKAIVGIGLGPRFVTTYEVANKIHASAAMAQSIAASALTPAAAYLRSNREALRDMFLRGSSYAVAVSMPVTAAAFIFAEPLIRTWLGESLTDAAGPTRLFLAYLVFVGLIAVPATMVVALGHVRPVLTVATANLAVNVAISVVLVGPLGVEGVILGTLVGQALAFPVLVRYFLARFDCSLGEWVRRVLVPNVPGLLVQAATAWPLLWLAERAGNLAEVGALVLVSMAASVAAYALVGLSREQRHVLIRTLRSAIGLGTGGEEPPGVSAPSRPGDGLAPGPDEPAARAGSAPGAAPPDGA